MDIWARGAWAWGVGRSAQVSMLGFSRMGENAWRGSTQDRECWARADVAERPKCPGGSKHVSVAKSGTGSKSRSEAGSEAGFVAMCAGVGAGVVCGRANA